jgi:uncharacterized protein (DUF427 family)
MRPRRIESGPGQESVWDYPRSPCVESVSRQIKIVFNGIKIVDSCNAQRVLETSHPPVYYIPERDIQMHYLVKEKKSSYCEWKGRAEYYSVVVGNRRTEKVTWSYPNPSAAFKSIKGHFAFYAGPMDVCYVDGERVVPQPGGFYGGWITKDILGPFKGEPGTQGW